MPLIMRSLMIIIILKGIFILFRDLNDTNGRKPYNSASLGSLYRPAGPLRVNRVVKQSGVVEIRREEGGGSSGGRSAKGRKETLRSSGVLLVEKSVCLSS